MYAQLPTPDASQTRTPARPWQVRSLSCMAWRAWLAMASGSQLGTSPNMRLDLGNKGNLKQIYIIPIFKSAEIQICNAILKSRGPGIWRVLENPYAAMGLKRSSSTSLDDLRDLLTYNCPITGKKRCPPCGKENIPMILILFLWGTKFYLTPILSTGIIVILALYRKVKLYIFVWVDPRKER